MPRIVSCIEVSIVDRLLSTPNLSPTSPVDLDTVGKLGSVANFVCGVGGVVITDLQSVVSLELTVGQVSGTPLL